jgi:hypothetical protein
MDQELEQLIKQHNSEVQASGNKGLIKSWASLKTGLDRRLEDIVYGNTPVIIFSPEVGKITTKLMGPFAGLVYSKRGGLGDVVAAQCDGLSSRLTPDGKHLPVHLGAINLQRAFAEKIGMDKWEKIRKSWPHDFFHLVTSPLFSEQTSPYEKSPEETALIFQERAILLTKRIRAGYGGRGIVIANDWMAEGLLAAYCRLRGIPLLVVSHNSHTGKISMQKIYDRHILRPGMEQLIYKVYEGGRAHMDSKATGIMNATIPGFVGRIFLEEWAGGYYRDRNFIGTPARLTVEDRHWNKKDTRVLPNGISPEQYPENQNLIGGNGRWNIGKIFKPGENVPQKKKENLLLFQKEAGLHQDENAILLFWPSRLDDTQKGIELFDKIAMRFINDHPGVQISVVGNNHASTDYSRKIGGYALDSWGRMFYSKFDENLSRLCYRAADITFGAALYEPFCQIDVLGWLHGSIHVNRATSGPLEKYLQMCAALKQEPQNSRGISVLFQQYNSNALYWALDEAVKQVRFYKQNPDIWKEHQYQLMTVPREIWSQDRMIDEYYLPVLTELNGGIPLFLPKAASIQN